MEVLEAFGIYLGLTFGTFAAWLGLFLGYAVIRDWRKDRKLSK